MITTPTAPPPAAPATPAVDDDDDDGGGWTTAMLKGAFVSTASGPGTAARAARERPDCIPRAVMMGTKTGEDGVRAASEACSPSVADSVGVLPRSTTTK